MTESQDRRAPGVNRVAVARVVDICGRDATVPAFEAESVELSGRGMHVRTPYLPPPGSPLVCRLEEDGREIVVEGVVAWQREREGGGEFGIQFTALDSGSVEALKELCGIEAPAAAAPAAPVVAPEAPKAPPTPAGTPVKLHIEGLGAPMKARVKDGGSRKLQVGSNLEFLKVGRGLEVENVQEGERRGAKIDAVSIAIDPQTQVPQLVVVLKYEGEDTTPEPSVVGAEEIHAAAPAPHPVDVDEPSAASPPVSVDDDDGEVEDDADALRGKVDAFAASMGSAAQKTSEKLSRAGGAAASHFVKWMKGGGKKLGELAARRGGSAEKRRSTAPAPASTTSTARRLRPQNGSRPPEADDGRRRKMLIGLSAGGVVLVTAIGIAIAGSSSKSAAQAAAAGSAVTPTAELAPAPTTAVAAAPGAVAAPPAMAAAPAAYAAPGAPQVPGVPVQRPGVVANVPLFGPTPMATLEPAPLGPAPEQVAAAVAPQAGVTTNLVPPSNEERMEEDEADEKSARDESFSGSSKKEIAEKSTEVHPEDVKPWGQGTLHLPVVHRLKLDKPGAALKGSKDPAGFTVTVPGRKVLESGTAIAKRDDRIADVRTKNGPNGAQITFVFRSKIPGYKVRLRKNYVEFFVSSPGGK